ncbi:MAG: hypothetical protein RR213_07065 [Raoultibacter sp.]
MNHDDVVIPENFGGLAMDALAEYERVFGEVTFSNIDMTTEETVEAVKASIASGQPLIDDIPDGAFI